LAEIEGEFECTKVALKQKEKDVEEYRKVTRFTLTVKVK